MEHTQISVQEVKHLASLVKINLSDEEIVKYQKQFVSILKYIDQLNEIDTTNVDNYEWKYPQNNVLREDIPQQSLSIEKVLNNSKNKNDHYFTVPTVVIK